LTAQYGARDADVTAPCQTSREKGGRHMYYGGGIVGLLLIILLVILVLRAA
jgi:hypothetical protein